MLIQFIIVTAIFLLTGCNNPQPTNEIFDTTDSMGRVLFGTSITNKENPILTGTLGALVRETGTDNQYLLSNAHVYFDATPGDAIIYPSLADADFDLTKTRVIGHFTRNLQIYGPSYTGLSDLHVDAGLALIEPDTVNPQGEIAGIGSITSTPITATLTMPVKKHGRTTSLTYGRVVGIGATVFVQYSNPGTGQTWTNEFIDQIVVECDGCSFSAPGDSGSLVVHRTLNRPVGLLFAGNSISTIVNPIADVLSELDVTVVGMDNALSSSSDKDQGNVKALKSIMLAKKDELRAIPDSVGHCIVMGSDGQLQVQVFILNGSREVRGETVGDMPVIYRTVEPFRAFNV